MDCGREAESFGRAQGDYGAAALNHRASPSSNFLEVGGDLEELEGGDHGEG